MSDHYITEGWFNVKMSSDLYRVSLYKDKTVSQPSQLYDENPWNGKTVFDIESTHCFEFLHHALQLEKHIKSISWLRHIVAHRIEQYVC